MNVNVSDHASVTQIMINHKYWLILIYDNSHITGIILEHVEQFYEWSVKECNRCVPRTPTFLKSHMVHIVVLAIIVY